MDILQIALIFLIVLLAVFLSIIGVQVFFILRDLKKALDKLNIVLQTGEEIAKDLPVRQAGVEKPVAAGVISAVEGGVKVIQSLAKSAKPKSSTKPKFYKKILR